MRLFHWEATLLIALRPFVRLSVRSFVRFFSIRACNLRKEDHIKFRVNVHVQGDPKKRNPGFNFAITSVNVHRSSAFLDHPVQFSPLDIICTIIEVELEGQSHGIQQSSDTKCTTIEELLAVQSSENSELLPVLIADADNLHS